MDQELVTSKVKDREGWVDSAKSILIFLVILGHTLQYFYCSGESYWSNPVFFFIYSFHMLLFSLLSGYLFYHYSNKVGLVGVIKNVL